MFLNYKSGRPYIRNVRYVMERGKLAVLLILPETFHITQPARAVHGHVNDVSELEQLGRRGDR
jgi:hypothetical protein